MQPSWKPGFSGLCRVKQHRSVVPGSIAQMVNSERIICKLLKEIYGYDSQDIKKLDVLQGAPTDIQGHLSDSGRVSVSVDLVNGERLNHHWFVKIMPLHANKDLVAKFDVFKNEIEFYREILPRLNAFLKDSDAEGSIEFDVPELLFAQEDENRAIIILPDLSQEGYKQERDENGNRYLSKEKAVLAVESIAKIHAASWALQWKGKSNLNDKYSSLKEAASFWSNPEMTSRLFMMKEIFHDVLKESMDPNADTLAEKLQQKFSSEKSIAEVCKERYKGEDNSIMSLQHGDLHFNNLLFKHDGSRLRVMIVDWQLTYSGRVAGDASYLLMSSMDPNTRALEEDFIKDKYFASFQETLHALDDKASVSYEAIQMDYNACLPAAFFFSCGNVMQEDTKASDEKTSFALQLCLEASNKNVI